MASYEEIHGKRVETFSSDPTLDSSYEGQVWFNSTSGTLKTVVASAAWRSGTPISTSGYGAAGSGSLTAGLITGRNTLASGDTPSNATEEWNGSGWATGGNLSTARYYGGALGTQTATVFVGGDSRPPGSGSQTTAENYNGTSWTSGTAYPVAVTLSSGFGTTSAGVMCNGSDTTYSATTKEYNGSWTAGGDLSTARRWIATAGTQTAGLAFGGQVPPSGYSTNVTEAYDGSSWTSGGSLNVTRAVNAVGGGINQDASQTNALASGGYQSSGSPKTYFNETEAYDGTSWSAQPTMATARGYGTGGGTGSAGLVVGAYTGSLTTAVEEFDNTINTVTAGAWASSGSMNVARNKIAGAGIQTAALAFGSEAPPGAGTAGNKSESYNGTSWTETPTIQTNRDSLAGAGTQTSALAFGGDSQTGGAPSATPTGATEEFDGSSWSEQSDMSTARRLLAGSGTQTAALASTGYAPPSNTNAVEEYNGSSWTNGTGVSTARRVPAGGGTQTAGIIFGGYSTTTENKTEEYDGSSWTSGGDLNEARNSLFGMGLQTAALASGGAETGYVTSTEAYDGTTWSTRPNMATARGEGGSAINSTTTLGLVFGGTTGSDTGATEEFTGETTAVNARTLTTS